VPIKNSTFYDEILDQKIMHNLYIKTNVFLLLSKSEGFPRSMAEAMGTGSVIISTKVGSIPDHINSNNGFLIESELSEEQIVNQSIEILKQIISNKKSNELSQNSRSHALKNFSFNTFKFKYNNLLHESLS
jgi:glycosyltransferase involved in cell wall biosynthesis